MERKACNCGRLLSVDVIDDAVELMTCSTCIIGLQRLQGSSLTHSQWTDHRHQLPEYRHNAPRCHDAFHSSTWDWVKCHIFTDEYHHGCCCCCYGYQPSHAERNCIQITDTPEHPSQQPKLLLLPAATVANRCGHKSFISNDSFQGQISLALS